MPSQAAEDPAAKPGAAKGAVVAFNASVRVEVDAAGKPVKIEAPADLPAPIRDFIQKRVGSWQYEPAKINGVPASAVTFVRVGACAIPVAEGYRLGLDFKGNGPALETSAPWFLPPPPYPVEAQRRGIQGEFKVSYAIAKDGSTQAISIEPLSGTSGRDLRAFRDTLSKWIEDMRYQPEQVDGVPVATDMSFPVSFSLDGPARRLKPTESPEKLAMSARERHVEALRARAMASKECIAAKTPGGPLPIASNSPVAVTPVPAG